MKCDIILENTVERSIKIFEKYDCVKSASRNDFFEGDETIKTSYTATSNDPQFNEEKQWNMKQVDVPRAWNKIKNQESIYVARIAVIDCGVQMNHKEISGIFK